MLGIYTNINRYLYAIITEVRLNYNAAQNYNYIPKRSFHSIILYNIYSFFKSCFGRSGNKNVKLGTIDD